MSFIDDLGKKIGDTAETLTNKAGETADVQRIKAQIRSAEKENDVDLISLGRAVYEKYQAGEEMDDATKLLCEAVQRREQTINDYQQQISDVKGVFECPSCGKTVSKQMAYCPYCGAPTPDDVVYEPVDYAGKVKEKAEDLKDKASVAVGKATDSVKNAADKATDAVKEARNRGEQEPDADDEKDDFVPDPEKEAEEFQAEEAQTEDTEE